MHVLEVGIDLLQAAKNAMVSEVGVIAAGQVAGVVKPGRNGPSRERSARRRMRSEHQLEEESLRGKTQRLRSNSKPWGSG
jgi:hypothetical protein